MRKLLVTLLVLAALFVGLDRVAVTVVDGQLAKRLQESQRLTTEPTVSVQGFPFLTQVVRGRYDEVDVRVLGVDRPRLRLQRVSAQLRDVRLPLSAAFSGSVDAVPVRQVDGQVVLGYADLERAIGSRRLSLAPEGGLLAVTGMVDILGQTLRATALSSVTASGTTVTVTGQRYRVGNAAASDAVSAALGGRLDFTVELDRLPFGFTLTSADVTPQGVVLRGRATGVVLSPGG